MAEFKTKDLVLATYLRYKDVPLSTGYDYTTNMWVFSDPDKCEKYSLELHNGATAVEVIKYESIRRNLLGMAHDKSQKR